MYFNGFLKSAVLKAVECFIRYGAETLVDDFAFGWNLQIVENGSFLVSVCPVLVFFLYTK